MPFSGHFLQTKTALGCLEEKFSCNKCCQFAGSPVTLGGCEHIFCSTCCEDYLGAACPVCGIPAHVKDADVDRQLFNLATLCKRLRSELNMDAKKGDDFKENEDPQIQSTPNQPIPASFSNNNHVTDQSHVANDNLDLEQQRSRSHTQISPQVRKRGSGVVSEIKMGPRNNKRSSVETEINNGVMGLHVLKSKVTNTDSMLTEKNTGKRPRSTIKTLSRNSPSKRRRSLPAEQTTMTQFYEYDEENEGLNIEEEDLAEGHVEVKDNGDEPVKKQRGKQKNKSDSRKDGPTRTTRLRHSLDSNIGRLKDVVTTPEKANVSEPAGSIKKDTAKGKHNKSTKATKGKQNENIMATDEVSRKDDKGKLADGTAGKTTKKLGNKQSNLNESITAQTPSTPATARPKTKTPRTPVGTPKGRQLQSQMKMTQSPALNKRNAKGETPLQVAAIKNEIDKLRQLLSEGANPNVRDNAGWTPLHEACNHGYLEVAELLLDHGAMINIPGLENDTPLHDAIENGRVACVKLLVSRGASLTLRNMHGQTAHDLAVSPEMKKALKTPVVAPDNTQTAEPVDILKYQPPCLLGTGLSREEKVALQKAAHQLQVKLTDEVSPEVTHIVTKLNSEGMCPRTVKIVQGILLGKWILSMEWLETCSRMGSLVCEEAFEAQGTSLFPGSEAPSKGRLNRINQLPGLFDGCHFYFHGTYDYATPTKEDLINIVTAGGGKILSREPKPGHLDMPMTVPYHVDSGSELARCCVFIVHEDQVKFKPIRTKFMCSVPSSWLMDCASNFKFGKLPSVN